MTCVSQVKTGRPAGYTGTMATKHSFRVGGLVRINKALGLTLIHLQPILDRSILGQQVVGASADDLHVVMDIVENSWNRATGGYDVALRLMTPVGGVGWTHAECNRILPVEA